ncbi:PEGA domain-containing protein [Streptomyces sp. NPDC047042]|uniref:PEGA domain-containing protein n=1 Tax=Streptomyces sp. NPDC047042 TaxID=3154807 RepID=UPI0033F5FB73
MYTPRLIRSLREGMTVLLDRNFAAQTPVTAMAKTGAHVLVRVKSGRRLPVLGHCSDGSHLSAIGAVPVPVIDCEITITTAAGHRTGLYRRPATKLIPPPS